MPFQKGQSGNPSGRPKAVKNLRAELVRRYGADAKSLVDKLDELKNSDNPKIALSATELLLAYLVGKPVQSIEASGPEGMPLVVTFGGRFKPHGGEGGA